MRSILFACGVSLVSLSLLACSATVAAPQSNDAGPIVVADGGADAALDAACEAEATAIREGLEAERAKQKVQHAVVAVETARCKARVFRADDPTSQDVVTDDSLWRIGSVTKTFVAATVLNLAAAGKLGLEDTLDKYVPTYPNAPKITVRQLLNHTSGTFNYTNGDEFAAALAANPKKVYSGTDLLAFAAGHPPAFEPGTSWDYSNTNYVLLGLVVEKATGSSIGKMIREHALQKAGLGRTFLAGEEPIAGAMVPGYQAKKDVTNIYDPSVAWAAGAMVASPADLLTWIHALYGSEAVLSAASTKEMLTFVPRSDYGLGVSFIGASSTLGNGRGLGHGGSIFGYQTQAFWFDETKVGVVAIVSDTKGDPNAFSLVALRAIADQ